MSILGLIIGDSGLGKTAALRNLDPATTLHIQATPKPLPFPSKSWRALNKDNPDGSILVTDDYAKIHRCLDGAPKNGKSVIVIDDANYLMQNEELRRTDENGYKKYNDMAKNFIGIIDHAQYLPSDTRIYINMHTQTTIDGKIKPKTTGKFIDEKIILEGLFSIVFRVHCTDGRHYYTTKTNGSDPVKTPMGMFNASEIDNDLQLVDDAIKEFYGLE